MPTSPDEIIALVQVAFQGVTLGAGVGLYEGHAEDGIYTRIYVEAERAKDEKLDWAAIPAARLDECPCAQSFFDAEGMRFHLPALIIADLRGETECDPVISLTHPDDYSRDQLSLLTVEQRAAVRAYLGYVRDHPEVYYSTEEADRALSEYWRD